jgi:4-hydroxy-3-polyprenylbenzoate decarboxylase
VHEPVSPHLEMTALCDRVLRASGPALLFEKPTGHRMPVLGNLFGTPARVARAMGVPDLRGVRAFGELLANSRSPRRPRASRTCWAWAELLKTLWNMAPRGGRNAPVPAEVWEGPDVDLARLPVQHCWPGDVAPLITWGLVITRGPRKARQNLGIYRQQVLSRNQLIVRWLAHRGGALDFRRPLRPTPASPTRWPWRWAPTRRPAGRRHARARQLVEYQFAGLLRGARTEVAPALGVPLQVPATAEIVLEGHIQPDAHHASGWQHALEGPYGDHTGYYNEQRRVPRAHGGPHHAAQGRDLPQHLHRQTARRARRAGPGAERAVHPAAAKAVSRDRGLLPAARGCSYRMAVVQHPQGLRRATRGA